MLIGNMEKQYIQYTEDRAAEYRKQYVLPVIGVTGSVGKTTIKELTAEILSEKYTVLKSVGSCNGNISAVQNVFAIKPQHQVCVFEFGIDDFDQMERMVRCCRPTVPVLTGLSGIHLEKLKTLDHIYREKTHIFDTLSIGGKVIANGDSTELMNRLYADDRVDSTDILTYGLSASCMMRAENIVSNGMMGSRFQIVGEGLLASPMDVEINLPGMHMVQNTLCAVLLGLLFGVPEQQIRRRLSAIPYIQQRCQVIQGHDVTVIDDSYNASPASVFAALRLLEQCEGRRVCVLGDMNQLGAEEESAHRSIGALAAGIADELVFIGTLAQYMFLEAKQTEKEKKIYWYPDKNTFLTNRSRHIMPDDTVLVKASHQQGFSELVELLKGDICREF